MTERINIIKNLEELRERIDIEYTVLKQSEETAKLENILFKKAEICIWQMDYKELFNIYQEILNEIGMDDKKTKKILILKKIASMYWYPFSVDFGELYSYLKEFEKNNDEENMALIYFALSLAYRMRKRYDKAMQNTIKMLALIKEENIFFCLGYLQLSEIHLLKNNPNFALENIRHLISKKIVTENVYWHYRITLYMAYVYSRLNDFENSIEALEILNSLPVEIGKCPFKVYDYLLKASIYQNLADEITAEKFFRRIEELEEIHLDFELRRKYTEAYIAFLEQMGRYKEANRLHHKLKKIFFEVFKSGESLQMKYVKLREEETERVENQTQEYVKKLFERLNRQNISINKYEKTIDDFGKKEKRMDQIISLVDRLHLLIEIVRKKVNLTKNQIALLEDFKMYVVNKNEKIDIEKLKQFYEFFDSENILKDETSGYMTWVEIEELLSDLDQLLYLVKSLK